MRHQGKPLDAVRSLLPQEVLAPSCSRKVLQETPLWADPKVSGKLLNMLTLLIVSTLLTAHRLGSCFPVRVLKEGELKWQRRKRARVHMFTSSECLLPGQGLWCCTHSDLARSLKERNQCVREGVWKALV